MTPTDQAVLSAFRNGLTRSEIAKARDVTPQSIWQTCQRLRAQGHILPAPRTRPSTVRDRADVLWATGVTPSRAADLLGVSHSRACNLRREWLDRRDAYEGLVVVKPRVIDTIIQAVAAGHGLTVADLTGPRRYKQTCAARHEAMWRAYQERRPDGSRLYSLTFIGKRFGGRDHTSALHAIRRHEERVAARGEAA